MTELTITPNYEKKRLKLSGTVAAGEHVAVTVAGGWAWASATGAALRLRLVFADKLVAEFPRRDAEPAETWTQGTDTADAACELNTNSAPAMKYLKFGGPCLWVLDDPELGTLYGTGESDILPWHKEPGEVPYDLDGYPDFVAEAKAAIAASRSAIASAVDQATGIVAQASEAKSAAQSARSFAEVAASSASGSAAAATSAKTAAETAQVAAEAAQAAAEAALPLDKTLAIEGKAADAKAVGDAIREHGGGGSSVQANWTQNDATKPDYIKNKPETMPPSAHGHTVSEVTGLGDAATKNVGTASGTVAAGDDSRLNDARTPTTHKLTHATGGTDALTPADIGAQPAGSYASPSDIGIPAFSTTATYAVGAKVVYDNAIWNCTTAVLSAGAWTGTTNWTKLFDLAVDSTPTANSKALMTSGDMKTALDDKAPLASPAFTGTPTAPTPTAGDNSTNVATTAFVRGEVGGKANSAAIAPEFSSSSTYAVGDVVMHEGLRYKCSTAVSTAGAWVAANWTLEPVQTALGNVTPGPDNTKLDSTAAAPAFSTASTYAVDERCTYNGKLYRCTTAVTVAGAWDASNWTADTMTDPDAVLDVTSQNQLRVVAKDGTLLWAQGYDLASTSSATLACDATNLFTFAATSVSAFSDAATYAVDDRVTYGGKTYKCTTAVETAGAWTGSANWTEDPDVQAFSLPSAATGKVGDFGLDVDNTANATTSMSASLTGLDSAFSVVVPKGENLADMLTFEPGEMAEMYFTLTAFRVNNLPTWHIVKQVVENGGATV